MLLYLYILLIISLFITSYVFIVYKRKIGYQKVNYLTEKSLNEFLEKCLKKRKINNCNIKNTVINVKYGYNYLFFNNLNNNTNFEDLIFYKKTNKVLWHEDYYLMHKDLIYRKINSINKKWKNVLFRAFNGKVIINEIAKSYVFLSLNKSNFNHINHFKVLVYRYKLYKKEIQVLPDLVKYYYVKELLSNMHILAKIRKNILKFDKINTINAKNLNNKEYIYAVSGRQYISLKHKFNLDFEKEIYKLSCELLNYSYQNKLIIDWLKTLI